LKRNKPGSPGFFVAKKASSRRGMVSGSYRN